MSVLPSLGAGLVYGLFAAVPLAIAVISRRDRTKPGATPLAVTGVFTGLATVIQGLRYVEPLLDLGLWPDVVLHVALLIAINLAVLGTLYIAVEYTGQRWLVSWWLVGALAVLGAVFPTVRILAETAEASVAGPVANGDFLYRTALATVSLVLFSRQFLSSRGVYRKQSATLLVGLAVGSLFGLIERFYTVEFVEFTLIGMTLGYVVLAWSLFRYELLETVPVARETLFDQVTDPVVAIDGAGRVVDMNTAAYETFGVSAAIIGAGSGDLFHTDGTLLAGYEDLVDGSPGIAGIVTEERRHFQADHPVFAALRDGRRPADVTIGLLLNGDVRYFRVSVSTLELAPEYEGSLVVFRDVTRSKEREQDLDILKQVLTRVLRHNLRNDVSAIQGYAHAIAGETDGDTRHNAERIVAMAEDLTETSETARQIEDVIDADGPQQFDIATTVGTVTGEVRATYPEAVVDCDLTDGVTVTANPELPAAFTEILENAIVHSEGTPRVRITGERSGRWYEVEISDDGPGIPSHELETIAQGEETALVHGSGAGLWLIQLVVEDSNGDVDYETDSGGTRVRVRLPVAGMA